MEEINSFRERYKETSQLIKTNYNATDTQFTNFKAKMINPFEVSDKAEHGKRGEGREGGGNYQ